VAYVGALVLALQLGGVGWVGVGDEPALAEPVAVAPVETPAPPRPSSAPKRIPQWAWGMYRWHDDRQANARPLDAPSTLPRWYWEWRAWQNELEP
jgi:hypothetical protein